MWNLKEFESIYSRYESSGLKVRDYCANEVINEAKFYYWQKKLLMFIKPLFIENLATNDQKSDHSLT